MKEFHTNAKTPDVSISTIKITESLERIVTISCLQLLVCTQLAFTCSKLTIETLEDGLKYVSS